MANANQFASFAFSDLAVSLAAGALTVTVEDGTKFPSPTTGQYFYAVIWRRSQFPNPMDDEQREIVKVSARSGNNLTITRAHDSTQDADHLVGSGVVVTMALCIASEWLSVLPQPQDSNPRNFEFPNGGLASSVFIASDVSPNDPTLSWLDRTNSKEWLAGCDVSDAQTFKLVLGSSFAGGSNRFAVTTGGLAGFGPTSPATFLHCQGATTSALCAVRVENTSAGNDAKFQAKTQSGAIWSFGVDESDSSKFKISYAEDLGSGSRLYITSGGSFGFNTTPSVPYHFLTSVECVMRIETSSDAQDVGLEISQNSVLKIDLFYDDSLNYCTLWSGGPFRLDAQAELDLRAGGARVARATGNYEGLALKMIDAAPTDADLFFSSTVYGSLMFYLDQTGSAVKARVRDDTGTYHTITVGTW